MLPALVLNYFGQGATILSNAEAARNPFYLLAPGWALLPMVALSTLATVIDRILSSRIQPHDWVE